MTGPGRPGVRFTVRLTPRGGLDRVDGIAEGSLKARVAAPPIDGGANRALIRLLSRELGVPLGAIRLLAGESGRNKLIAVDGLTREAILERWPDLRL